MRTRGEKNILLTAFRGSSAELLVRGIDQYPILILPNNKIKDSEKLIAAISNGSFDYVISLGQRPNIKNKIHIETTAKDRGAVIETAFDCDGLMRLFEKYNIVSKISHNAGTSFCNKLYWNGLEYISTNNLKTKMVFLHIPFAKNITDIDSFREHIFHAVAEMPEIPNENY